MDRGFPVRDQQHRFSLPPRSLIPETHTTQKNNSRIYVDNRLQHMLNLRFDVPFFQRGKFPASVSNASQEIIVPNPWTGRGNSAPFDQRTSSSFLFFFKLKIELSFFVFLIEFYLILDVAIGGTNGWFPDGAGNKPWLNGALGACFVLPLY